MSNKSFMEKLLDGVEVEWKPLGGLAQNLDSMRKPITSGLRESGKIPYYGASGIVDYVEDYIFDGDFLLVSEDGANLVARNTPIAFSISGKSWVNNHAHILKFNTYVERRFVDIYLNSIDLTPYISGAAQPKLNQKNLNCIQIPIPCPENPKKSLEIQAEIVRILDTFTELTTELTSELTARKKQYNYYRDQLLSFEEGEVEWKALGEVSDIYDSLHQTPQYAESGLSMIRVTDIKGSYVNLEKTLRVNKEIFAQFTKKYLPKKNDLVMSRVGSYGNVGIVPVDDSACMGQNTVVIHPIINSKYLFYILVSNIGQSFIERNVGGGNQKTLSLKSIKAIPIPLVCEKEQERIATALDKFDALTSSITEGLPREIALRQQQYEYYRDLLLSFPKPDAEVAA